MNSIPQRGRAERACLALSGVGDSRSASLIAIRKSIELCRKTDAIVERLRQPVIAATPIIPGKLEHSLLTVTPEDWTKESILKLIRRSASGRDALAWKPRD